MIENFLSDVKEEYGIAVEVCCRRAIMRRYKKTGHAPTLPQCAEILNGALNRATSKMAHAVKAAGVQGFVM